MTLVRVVAWIYLAVAALAVVAGAGEEAFGLVAMGFAAAVAGVVFLAIDRIIVLLTEIRDRLPSPNPVDARDADDADANQPTMSISELDAALAAKREPSRFTFK